MTRHVDPYRITRSEVFQRFIPNPQGLASLGLGVVLKKGKAVLGPDHPFIVYRYPSRNDDTRTLIATALDEKGFLYSKGYVHGLRTPGASVRDILALLGYLNSFVCDWWVRRFTDRHITQPVMKNIPLPGWEEKDRETVAKLVSALLVRGGTRRLPGGAELVADPGLGGVEDMDLFARIDKQVLEGFGLGYAEFEAALEDFSENACPELLRAKVRELLA
jgi:hypothetical protein